MNLWYYMVELGPDVKKLDGKALDSASSVNTKIAAVDKSYGFKAPVLVTKT